MKSVEFDGVVMPDGQISIPAELARQVPSGELVRIVLRWDVTGDEDMSWSTLGLRSLGAAYSPEDAVYERLMNED